MLLTFCSSYMRETFPVKVISNEQIAPNAWLLVVPRKFDFIAGQVTGITLDAREEPRLYSIASGTQHKEIWILYTIKPGGLLTPPLSEIKPGNTIRMTMPFGQFICREEKAIWIATGTGIAPFASMIFSGQHHSKILIQGNRDRKGLYFYEKFINIPGLSYHPCCSRVAHDGCFNGRVTDFVQNMQHPDPAITYYLCGIAEMVVDTRDLLIERGVPYNQIMAEIFF
jgi:ferredoxin/flavodoxin---NADP+ reductase